MKNRNMLFSAVTLLLAVLWSPAPAEEGDDSRKEALDRIRALHERLELAPRDSFLNYAIATIARREGIDLKELKKEGIVFPIVPVVTDDPARRVDLFGLTAGAVAIHESLQLTELIGPPRPHGGETVALDKLEPPDLPSLDFEDLLGEREIVLEEEALFIPAEWAYLRFASGRDLLAFLDEADLWVGHAMSFYGATARGAAVIWRCFERLGMPDPRRFPAFYQVILGPIAVTMSDPFLREGTDLTVILPPGSAALSEVVEALETPGTAARRHQGRCGDRIVLSTSRVALDRALAVGGVGTDSPSPESLAAAADFRYMRSLLPAGAGEAVFAYLSESFLQRLVGPRLRILESRRVRCASHLRTIVNGALLFFHEKGREPEGIAELVENGYLEETVSHCPHGGSYEISDGFTASCHVHNRLGDLTPHIELDLVEVDQAEAWAYRRFARAYRNFWRRYFDPAGISISREGGSWHVDLAVLPLAENSLYRNLSRLTGGPPLDGGSGPVADSTVLLLSGKVDRALVKDLERQLERLKLLPEEEGCLDGFGDRATLGLLDGTMLFGFDLAGFAGESVRWGMTDELLLAPLLAGAALPVYVTVPIDDREKVDRFLDEVRRGLLVQSSRPGLARFALKYDTYDLGSDIAPGPIHALSLELFAFKFRLFYTILKDHLVLATRPEVLKDLAASRLPHRADDPYNVKLSLFPGVWKKLKPDMEISYAEAARRRCHKTLHEIQPFLSPGLDKFKVALGEGYGCPDYGTYGPGEECELCCTIHGSPSRPAQEASPMPENPVSRILESLDEVTFSLRFTEHGIRCSIRIKR